MARAEFSPRTKRAEWEAANGKCRECGVKILPSMRRVFDHICPDALKGLNDFDNCQLLCGGCHDIKTGEDKGMIAKADRQRNGHIGAKTRKGRPLAGTVASGWRKRMDGTVERRE